VICPIYEAASLPTAMIEFRALGTVVLRTPEGEDIRPVLAQPKRVALLAYLAAARPHGFHRRDRLLALFWPEQDERHARWALNQALQHLRGSLGKQVVVSRGDGEVGVDPAQLACDVAQFETALDAGENDQALELYRGDLLDGFHLSGAGEFERWLEEERGRLRQRAARAASVLAQRHAPAQSRMNGKTSVGPSSARRSFPGALLCSRSPATSLACLRQRSFPTPR
jgi:DNA-binding SARP family transcriptional activator